MNVPRRLIRGLGKTSAGRAIRRRRAHRRDAFGLFTDRARDAFALAQDEARGLGHEYLGTEHVLLGLLRRRDGVAARVLGDMGVHLVDVRAEVERIIGRGSGTTTGERRLTPRAKRVLELAVEEAERLRHDYVGTEHLLLGIVREGEGVAAEILDGFGVTAERVDDDILRIVGRGPAKESA